MKVTTLKGIFPDPKPLRRKNFIHENMKNLRQMEQCFQANKEIEELQKLQLPKYKTVDKYQNISPKVATNFQKKKKYQGDNTSTVLKDNVNVTLTDKIENKKQQPEDKSNTLESNAKHVAIPKKIFRSEMDSNLSDKQRKQGGTSKCNKKYSQKMQLKVSSKPNMHKFETTVNKINIQNTVKYKNQEIQTLNIDQMDSIYSEGIIRYPSKKIIKHDNAVSDINLNEQKEKALKLQFDSPTDRGNMHTPEDLEKLDLQSTVSRTHKKQVNLIKLNKEYTSVANKLAMQLNNYAPPAHYRKGVIPKYLQERKEVQQKELKAKAEMSHSDYPENHVPLPDHERKETLGLLKKNYQEYINELNMMSIKTDTLRVQRRKMEIEKRLSKLEEGIQVFSRPKVFREDKCIDCIASTIIMQYTYKNYYIIHSCHEVLCTIFQRSNECDCII